MSRRIGEGGCIQSEGTLGTDSGIRGGSTSCRKDGSHARSRVYPDELRQRAVGLVGDWQEARGVTEGGYTPISKDNGEKDSLLPISCPSSR